MDKEEGTFLKPLKISNGDWLDSCPHCGGNNLHHSHVSIFNSDGYDVEWNNIIEKTEHKPKTRVTHVMQDNTITTARVPPSATNNPSSDRNGILIEFWCETCEEKPTMAILQHKGITFIGWK